MSTLIHASSKFGYPSGTILSVFLKAPTFICKPSFWSIKNPGFLGFDFAKRNEYGGHNWHQKESFYLSPEDISKILDGERLSFLWQHRKQSPNMHFIFPHPAIKFIYHQPLGSHPSITSDRLLCLATIAKSTDSAASSSQTTNIPQSFGEGEAAAELSEEDALQKMFEVPKTIFRMLEVVPKDNGCQFRLTVKRGSNRLFETFLEESEFNLLRRLMKFSIPGLCGFHHSLGGVDPRYAVYVVHRSRRRSPI